MVVSTSFKNDAAYLTTIEVALLKLMPFIKIRSHLLSPSLGLGPLPIKPFLPVWVDLGESEDIYLARVSWKDAGALIIQLQNRRQTENSMLLVDAYVC